MKKPVFFSLLLFLSAFSLSAQVVRFPRVFEMPEFRDEAGFLSGGTGWLSLRHVINQSEAPDFGHDWESGINLSIFSSGHTIVAGLAEETFHFSAAPETESSWFFNPASIISDLRLIVYQRLDPAVVGFGFQHDCKHDVDRSSVRMQIHDLLFLLIKPVDDIKLLETGNLLLDTNGAVEGGFNLPAVFQGAPPQPDLGHLSGFFRARGLFLTKPRIGITADASVSATWRSGETSVTGLESLGLDYNIRGGLTAVSAKGTAGFYIGTERLTDSWTDFDEQPVAVNYISLELSSAIR